MITRHKVNGQFFEGLLSAELIYLYFIYLYFFCLHPILYQLPYSLLGKMTAAVPNF